MASSICEVGRTALIIAAWRADEAVGIDSIVSDHIANIFLDEETTALAASIASVSPSTKFLVMHRARIFDDLVFNQIDLGVDQIVSLGAGLDSRALRLAGENTRFFEVDHADVLAFKEEVMGRHGYSIASTPVPCDYTDDVFIGTLVRHGLEPSRETFFIWEGNTMYLSEAHIIKVLRNLGSGLDSFQIAFDYLSRDLIERKAGFQKAEDLVDSFANMGAPWITGFDDITDLARDVEMNIVRDSLIAEMLRTYDLSFKSAATLLKDYSVCVLQKPLSASG